MTGLLLRTAVKRLRTVCYAPRETVVGVFKYKRFKTRQRRKIICYAPYEYIVGMFKWRRCDTFLVHSTENVILFKYKRCKRILKKKGGGGDK
jgi:hypothetical protein